MLGLDEESVTEAGGFEGGRKEDDAEDNADRGRDGEQDA